MTVVTPTMGWARSFLLLTCIACAASAGTRTAGADRRLQPILLEPGLVVRQVAAGAYEITHALPWPANSLLVEMADHTLVLVATPYTPAATRRVLDWARGHFGVRGIVAINNGFHVDNLGGNAALREAGIPVYGSDLTVRLLRERGEETRQQILKMIGDPALPEYMVHAAIPYLPPDRVFPIAPGVRIKLGTEEVWVIYPGPSQAPDKVAVYFPSRRLLYGGCMILGGSKAGNIADADLNSWPRAIARLAALPVTVVIPGHGDRLDASLVQHTLDMLARTR